MAASSGHEPTPARVGAVPLQGSAGATPAGGLITRSNNFRFYVRRLVFSTPRHPGQQGTSTQRRPTACNRPAHHPARPHSVNIRSRARLPKRSSTLVFQFAPRPGPCFSITRFADRFPRPSSPEAPSSPVYIAFRDVLGHIRGGAHHGRQPNVSQAAGIESSTLKLARRVLSRGAKREKVIEAHL